MRIVLTSRVISVLLILIIFLVLRLYTLYSSLLGSLLDSPYIVCNFLLKKGASLKYEFDYISDHFPALRLILYA